MEWQAKFSHEAQKYLDRLPFNLQLRLISAANKLPEGDVHKLRGRGGFRLTVGGFRLLFERDETEHIFRIFTIAPRGDVYKK